MAETAVSLVFDRLEKLLRKEYTIFAGVHNEVNSIKNDLKLINSFLDDADNQAEAESGSRFVKDWVEELRKSVAFRMENVVDHYLLKVAERDQRDGLFGAITRGAGVMRSVTHRHDIANDIKVIRETMDHLLKQKEQLSMNFRPNRTNTNENTRRLQPRQFRAHYVEESDLVGIEHDHEVIMDWLFSGEIKLSVMVVVGSGGIGKTTIVKNVYNKHSEMKTFDCFAWITVPPSPDYNKIFQVILTTINETAVLAIEASDGLHLTNKVRDCLNGKKYLIVFDNVCESNFWEEIKVALVDNKKSSRVIFVTRDQRIQDYFGTGTNKKVHTMKTLSERDALKLFHRTVFQDEECPDELGTLSEDFVKRCNGLPLVILAIAGLLSRKEKTVIEWRNVYNRLGLLLQNDSSLQIVEQVHRETYHDLPSHLKRCLLYFGLFPEDYSISCMRLIRLWVAEDFVKETENDTELHTTMEEYAMDYLTELCKRNLVKVSMDFDGKPKRCQVDHLMHKFIARKCKEQSFSQVMGNDEITKSDRKLDSVGRRLTILAKNNEITALRNAKKWKQVRSCFVFDEAKKWPLTKPFFSGFELVTGLDLSGARLDLLPEQIGDLLNIKYLSLRNTNITSLPKSIGKCVNLQTLDLKRTQVQELPEEVKNLINLRHLLAYYINNQHSGLDRLQGVKLMKGLQNLTSLLKLSFFDATNSSSSMIDELAKLKHLRKLGIIKLREVDGEALCKAIEGMTHLCSLSIGAMDILKLQSLRNPPGNLERLYLYGSLDGFPNWIQNLNNLTRLYLKWSSLQNDPLSYLGNLSKLLHLELYDTYGGEELHFKKECLTGLKVLHLESMKRLKTIKIDKGAVPHLEKMKIGKCHEMVKVPKDVKNLKSLQVLILYDMSPQFVNRITGPHGEDYSWSAKEIPVVLYAKDDHFAIRHALDAMMQLTI